MNGAMSASVSIALSSPAVIDSTVVPSPSALPSAARFARASASPFACVMTELMKLSERSWMMNAVTSHTIPAAAARNTRLAMVRRFKCPGWHGGAGLGAPDWSGPIMRLRVARSEPVGHREPDLAHEHHRVHVLPGRVIRVDGQGLEVAGHHPPDPRPISGHPEAEQ